MINKYVEKGPKPVEAVRYSGTFTSAEEVIRFFEEYNPNSTWTIQKTQGNTAGYIKGSAIRTVYVTDINWPPRDMVTVPEGCYLIRREDGFYVMNSEDFSRRYELMDETCG